MTRRAFSVALVGVGASGGLLSARPPVVILKAMAGVRLPETLAIATTADRSRAIQKLRAGLFELRTYRTAAPGLASDLAAVFPRTGIRPLFAETDGSDLTYLIPFENLTVRDRAWTTLNADPHWIRARLSFQSYHFGLYKVA
jgi:hypothetical protein